VSVIGTELSNQNLHTCCWISLAQWSWRTKHSRILNWRNKTLEN
jgi:hypothetical protein